MKTADRLRDVTAEEVMKREPVTIPRRASIREAARLLGRGQVGEAAVVDEEGRCVGVLSAAGFLRWAEDGCPDAVVGPVRTCSYQTEGRLLTGEKAVICTLAPGSCPLQAERPTTGGRHATVCLQPSAILCDWQQTAEEELPDGGVAGRYVRSDFTSAEPQTPLAELARMMAEANAHCVFVLDESGRPVGVVSCTDVMALLLACE